MIKLVGLGLSIDMLTLGALYRLLTCHKVYVDVYTSYWYPSIEYLIRLLEDLGIDVAKAYRRGLEGESINRIVDEAKYKDVCIAVIGDPMIATTHSAIAVEALSKHIAVEILPAVSILNAAISLSCLQAYRFGKIVTIVRPKDGVLYEYPLHVIKRNRELGLHTLALLEIDLEQEYYMTPREAIEILFAIQRSVNDKVLDEKDSIIILRAIGFDQGGIEVMTIKEILSREFEKTLYTIVIPTRNLHPIEAECLQNIDNVVVRPQVNTQLLELMIKAIINNMRQKLYNT